ncbi:conserved hypothetical protein [Paecilomyces variotii No. 5]|uniref:Erythromycin esterase n=1 Tax=Byssochlamys spectabilis (strain No. 5 / NBRC 109023) TaxID=1356009 RepID=V5FMQ4_BYSSN|nr:conserved hypothetical protein [Paecilomyces variotii No. 5]
MVRRSARLRGSTPTEVSLDAANGRSAIATPILPTISGDPTEAKPSPATVAKLSALTERDETPEVGSQPNIQTVMSTPATKSTQGRNPMSSTKSPLTKTPTTAGDVKPPREEMHPSKAHHSTTKQPDTGLILGFNPIKRDTNGNVIKEGILESTPTKARCSPRSDFGTPAYDFKFAQDAQLSEEAKKLMENVREDVARIKAKMILDKAEQARKEGQAADSQNTRKIAKPKGMTGRFSEAHMAEFKKMDSIAGHPSAFRATPGRLQSVTKTLKRKSSKACLEERSSPSKAPTTPSRIAELATAKRIKKSEGDDASTGRPEKKTEQPKLSRPSTNSRPRAPIRSSLMTPTKASSLRSATAKPSKISMLPVAHSPLSKMTIIPRTPQTEFNPRLKTNLPSLGNLKSILRRHQPLFSNDPAKIAAGTHVASPDFNPDIQLDKLPSVNFVDPTQTPSPKKRVEFTSSTKSRYELTQASPSPSKIPAPSAKAFESDIVYPALPLQTPEKERSEPEQVNGRAQTSAIRLVGDAAAPPSPFPNMPAVPHGINNKKRHRDNADGNDVDPAKDEAKQADEKPRTPAIRRVGRSTAPPSPFPNMPAVPHGINNKKRQRDNTDKDVENIPPEANDERTSKRQKMSTTPIVKAAPVSKAATPSPLKKQPIKSATPSSIFQRKQATPASARDRSKRILSLSRLNMLAKPKQRT